MEEEHKISQYRERLDRTLASNDLADELILRTLVKNQLLISSKNGNEGDIDNILEKRTGQVSKFLDMLRSASMNDDKEVQKTCETSYAEWKLKQDTEDFRVMYHEGPDGTPFHTLLVEGYVDGPVDVCLCVSWETTLYRKWWPEFSMPAFKIISSQCLEKVKIGEEISLVRVKVSWPLSAREALLHCFEFEYFQDDLVVVLMNTISDADSIGKSIGGSSNNLVPEAKDIVRIDMVGGSVLQKVTPERTYFRTIVNMDMKLDYVPPSLINFMSRELIGKGFRLYQKTVASVTKGNEDFTKALEGPLYARVREALYSNRKVEKVLPTERHIIDEMGKDHGNTPCNANVINSLQEDTFQRGLYEIEEENVDENGRGDIKNAEIAEKCSLNMKEIVHVSPEVERALGTLDGAISVVRELRLNSQTRFLSEGFRENVSDLEKSSEKKSTKEASPKSSDESQESFLSYDSRHTGSSSCLREMNCNRIEPASPELQKNSSKIPCATLSTSHNEVTFDKTIGYTEKVSTEANMTHKKIQRRKVSLPKISRFCCF